MNQDKCFNTEPLSCKRKEIKYQSLTVKPVKDGACRRRWEQEDQEQGGGSIAAVEGGLV